MNLSVSSIILIVAIVLFVLAAIGIALGTIDTLALGLAFFAAAFLVRGGWRR